MVPVNSGNCNLRQFKIATLLCIILPISLGFEVKSLTGTGIFLHIYSHMTSMLYFNCADMGTIGEPSAIVPKLNNLFE